MKISPLKSSLLALALVSAPVPAFAASTIPAGSMVVAQADEENVMPAKGAKRIEAIRKFLAHSRDVSRLPDDRLNQRLKRVRAFQNTKGLPADLAAGLMDAEQQLTAEINRRGSAGAGTAQADNTDTPPAAPEASGGDAQSSPGATGAGGSAQDVGVFIRSAKPASSLQDKDLRQQVREAMHLMKTEGLDKAQRQQLRKIARDGRAELASRGSGKKTAEQPEIDNADDGAPVETPAKKAASASPAEGAPSEAAGFLESVRPPADLGDDELREQTKKATALMKSEGLSKEDRRKLRDISRDGRAELQKRGKDKAEKDQAKTDEAPPPSGAPVSDTDDSGTDDEAPPPPTAPATAATPAGPDQKATVLLADNTDVSAMSNKDLRNRLDSMRELLASKDLSPENKKALRAKLAAEKAMLRGRVAKSEGTDANGVAELTPYGNANAVNGSTDAIDKDVVKVVVADRRPSQELKEPELWRRVDVLRVIINDKNYSERERLEWRGILERDRALLRDRMLADRRRRQQDLVAGVNTGSLKIQIGLNFQPDRPPPPRAIFAAEAGDEEIEEVLAAPPRRAVNRRYTVEEVESSPDLRDAVARIEIDTVHFGFGEGFLREEEVGNLDRIAEIMERILAAHPGEVFVIEGHTDAVGDDAANLALSRERAAAVKEALVTYFVIPPENLKTVGFGERYLKIPTPEAEAENRRVSIARITPLVGALNE